MAQPAGFIPDAPTVPAGFVPDQPAAPPGRVSGRTLSSLITGAPAEPDPSWFQRYVAGPATGFAQDLLAQSPVGDVGQLVGGQAGREKAGELGARFVVPQSGIEAGALLATGGAGPLVSGAAKAVPVLARAPGWLARIMAGAAGGELGGQATGEPTGKGAAIGGLGAAAGEGLATVGGKVVRSLPGMRATIAAQDAERLGVALGELSAPLQGATTADALRALAAGGGQKKLGAAFETVVETIERSTPPLAVPALGGQPMKLSAIQVKLTELRTKAFPKTGAPTEHHLQLQETYDAARREVRAGLDAADPTGGALALYDRANAQYAKGKALLDLLGLEAVYRPGARGAELATPYLQRKLAAPKVEAKLRRKLNPSEFDRLVDAVTRGGGLGTTDVLRGPGTVIPTGLGIGGLTLGGPVGTLAGVVPLALPNVLSRYAGRTPYAASEGTRRVLDLLGQKGAAAVAGDVTGRP